MYELVRIRFWRRKKERSDIPTARLFDEKSDILLIWLMPSSVRIIGEIKEEESKLKFEYEEQPFEKIIQAGSFRLGNDLAYFVRGDDPHTFNPFLQADFDPETISRYEELALYYYSKKGLTVTDEFKRVDWQKHVRWITGGLMGILGQDESDRDFFNAIRESKLMLIMKMAAGVAIWEMVQQLVVLLGEAF